MSGSGVILTLLFGIAALVAGIAIVGRRQPRVGPRSEARDDIRQTLVEWQMQLRDRAVQLTQREHAIAQREQHGQLKLIWREQVVATREAAVAERERALAARTAEVARQATVVRERQAQIDAERAEVQGQARVVKLRLDAWRELQRRMRMMVIEQSLSALPESERDLWIPDPAETDYDRALRQTLDLVCERSLGDDLRRVLYLRFGLEGNGPLTYDELGEQVGLTPKTVRQKVQQALRILQHPARCHSLLEFKR